MNDSQRTHVIRYETGVQAEYMQAQREIERLNAENSLLSGTLESRDRNIEMLVEENKRMIVERDTLKYQILEQEVEFKRLVDVCHDKKVSLAVELDALKFDNTALREGVPKLGANFVAVAAERDGLKAGTHYLAVGNAMAALDATRTERDALRSFAQFVMESWPDGDIDGGELQDKAVELGLLKLEDPAPTEPCGEGCSCAEYYSDEDWAKSEVQCYRKTELLMGENI